MEYKDIIEELSLMQQIYATLFSLNNKIQVNGDKYFDVLTTKQFLLIIAMLHLKENETTVNNITKKLGCSKQNTNKIIHALEKKGYVITERSTLDKRAINTKLTELGKKATITCSEKSIYYMKCLFNKFTIEELETLWKLLKKLYSFDGQEQNGFEKDVSSKLVESNKGCANEVTERILKKLVEEK